MNDDYGFKQSVIQEVFRWDPDGKLVYIHPTIIDEVSRQVAERLRAPKTPPPVAPRGVPQFGSIDALVETIECMFDCKDGDHASHHSVYTEGRHETYPYTVLGLIALASISDAQERLRQGMYKALHKLKASCKSARPVLYWRYAKAVRVLEDVEHEMARYKIMTRIAIPEADFSVAGEMVQREGESYTVLQG